MSQKTRQELLQRIKELEHENTMLKEIGKSDKFTENYIHDILNNIAAPIFLKDSKGKYLYSNKRYAKVIHMLPADIIGKNDYDVIPQEIAELFRSQDQEVMAKKAPVEFEETISLPDGIQSFITAKFPLFGKDGTISGVGGFCTEITERKKAEANLRLAKEEAEEATKLKDKFVSLVSHDLKNPIQRMMSCLNLIDSTQEISEQGKEMMKEGYLACEDMATLINEILNLNRIKGGRIMPEYSFIHAGNITDSAIKSYALMANEKGIDLINDILKHSRIYADGKLLGEVVRNLISNAIKFSEKGDAITLYIPDGEKSTIAVTDTGIGIKDKHLKTLFKYEEKTSTGGTAGERGTGLGLPLARDIMKAHGGDLYVESTYDEGSTFYARLPHVRPKVLIVDDEQIIIDRIKDLLKVTDVKCLEAVTGKMAQEIIKQKLPNLILLDRFMPDMDGLELLEYIKSNPITRKIPVIVITGDPKIETRDKVFELGADDFITKPFNIEDLMPMVRRFVG